MVEEEEKSPRGGITVRLVIINSFIYDQSTGCNSCVEELRPSARSSFLPNENFSFARPDNSAYMAALKRRF